MKLIRVKEGLLKLSEAYLALSHKCIYIFEAQRDLVKCLPDVEDKVRLQLLITMNFLFVD